MFRGSAVATIDEKGRLKVPTDFRRPLEERCGVDLFVTSVEGELGADLSAAGVGGDRGAPRRHLPATDRVKERYLERAQLLRPAARARQPGARAGAADPARERRRWPARWWSSADSTTWWSGTASGSRSVSTTSPSPTTTSRRSPSGRLMLGAALGCATRAGARSTSRSTSRAGARRGVGRLHARSRRARRGDARAAPGRRAWSASTATPRRSSSPRARLAPLRRRAVEIRVGDFARPRRGSPAPRAARRRRSPTSASRRCSSTAPRAVSASAREGPLDMRMDPAWADGDADIVNS